MVGDRQYWGRVFLPLPPTIPCRSRRLVLTHLGQCTRWWVLYIQTFFTSSACHRPPVPPTGSEHRDGSSTHPELHGGLLCGQCTRWQVQHVLTGAVSNYLCCTRFPASLRPAVAAGAVFCVRRCGVLVASGRGSGSPLGLGGEASTADCCGSSNSGLF